MLVMPRRLLSGSSSKRPTTLPLFSSWNGESAFFADEGDKRLMIPLQCCVRRPIKEWPPRAPGAMLHGVQCALVEQICGHTIALKPKGGSFNFLFQLELLIDH